MIHLRGTEITEANEIAFPPSPVTFSTFTFVQCSIRSHSKHANLLSILAISNYGRLIGMTSVCTGSYRVHTFDRLAQTIVLTPVCTQSYRRNTEVIPKDKNKVLSCQRSGSPVLQCDGSLSPLLTRGLLQLRLPVRTGRLADPECNENTKLPTLEQNAEFADGKSITASFLSCRTDPEPSS